MTTTRPFPLVTWLCMAAIFVLLATVEARHVPPHAAQRNAMTTSGIQRGTHGRGQPDSLYVRRAVQEVRMGGKSKSTRSPTTSPTPSPTKTPSQSPSTSPSRNPTNAPTASPSLSLSPSTPPSASPTLGPTTSPSSTPTGSPTMSHQPTTSPSSTPTTTPSSHPTIAPTISMSPTVKVVETTQDADGVVTSSCVLDPPAGDMSMYNLEFLYVICFDSIFNDQADAQAIVTDLEPKIHAALVSETIRCDYTTSQLEVIRLSSAAMDKVTSAADEGECWEVDAAIAADIYFPLIRGRRGLSEGEVREYFIDTMKAIFPGLQGDDSIVSLTLQGFTNVQLEGTQTLEGIGDGSSSTPGVAGAQSGNIPLGQGRQDDAFGIFIIAVGGCVILALAVVAVRRRNQRRMAFQKHFEDVNALDLDTELKEEMQQRERVVNYDDGESDDDDVYLQDFEVDTFENHDYKTCQSVTCQICAERQLPIFIAAGPTVGVMERNIKADLGPPRNERHTTENQTQVVDDTQLL